MIFVDYGINCFIWFTLNLLEYCLDNKRPPDKCVMCNSVGFYFQALHTLIAIQKRYLDSIGKLTPAEEDSFWQVIIGQRVEVIFIIIFLL